ncbi:MAG: hypothetical protein KDK96_06995 [Chlamydiia bacterium]|nr:hypothetical protein [Chlamydiia bacterium]
MAVSPFAESTESLTYSSDPSRILTDALFIVNQRIAGKIVFLGQPGHTAGTPFDIRDLCELAFESGQRIGDVNIVVYKEGIYDHVKRERIIDRFYTAQELATLIERMVEDHRALKAGILETASGTQFDVTHLKENTLKVDQEGYFRVNGLRLWSIVWKDEGIEGPLLAEKLRSNTLLSLRELEGRISIIDPKDPAPGFYIDLSQKFSPPSQEEQFYLFCREWKQA